MKFTSLESKKTYLEAQINSIKSSSKTKFIIYLIIGALCYLISFLGGLYIILELNNDALGITFVVIFLGAFLFFYINAAKIHTKRKQLKNYQSELDLVTKTIESEGKEKIQTHKTQNVDTLIKYKELLDAGVIDQDEFERRKKEILNG